MRRSVKLQALGAATLAGVLLACWNDLPTEIDRGESPSTLVLSDTSVTNGSAALRGGTAHAITSGEGVTYVSLPSGVVPNGILAVIKNRRTGDTVVAPLTSGGLDPVGIAAQPGDSLATTVQIIGGGAPVVLLSVVPPRRRPVVVRTIPLRGKTAVPLNTRVTIVFSEPMDPQTLTAASIRLMNGSNAIPGQLTIVDAAGLIVEFTALEALPANATHQIVVTQDARDLDGERLESEVAVDFTTGSTLALASVTTDQTAMFTTLDGDVRTFEVNAVQYADQSFSGRFSIFYPAGGFRTGGRVTCFKIGIGRSVWLAGVLEDAADPRVIGTEWGWRLADNGPSGGVTPDMLSLAHHIEASGFGSGQAFCEMMPVFDPTLSEDIALISIEAGDIAVRYAGEPPPPPVSDDMSRIAFAASPNGGIRLMRADGHDVRPLTSGEDWNPSWSPDGKKIAFDRSNPSDGNRDIYVMNADGTGLKRLTSDPSFDADPEWSPDGRKFAFYRNGDIYVMNASDASGLTQLTSDGAHPTWSPDGSRIAFWSGRSGTWGVYAMNANGSGLTHITSDTMNASNPVWSPDGKSIAFQGDNGIFVINPDGSNLRRVALGGQDPAWSHDSRMIIYEWYRLRVINADGSGMTTRGNGFTPAWSPIGSIPHLPAASLTMEIAGGSPQTDTVVATLPQPLSVRLTRDDGTPAAGIRVFWQILLHDDTPKTPSLTSRSVTSDASGIASVGLTMGSVAGRWTVQAFVTDGSAHNAGVEFTGTALAGNPVRLEKMTLGAPLGVIDSTLEYAVFARDAHGPCPDPSCGNLVTGARITWAVTAGGGTIAPTEDTTATGRDPNDEGLPISRVVHTVGSVEGEAVVTATAPATPTGTPQATFTSTVVTRLVRVVWNGFVSDTVFVPAGKTVGWYWEDPDDTEEHNVTFEDAPSTPISSPTLGYGSTFTRTFSGAPRTIRYRCTLHSTSFTQGAVGVVIVQ